MMPDVCSISLAPSLASPQSAIFMWDASDVMERRAAVSSSKPRIHAKSGFAVESDEFEE